MGGVESTWAQALHALLHESLSSPRAEEIRRELSASDAPELEHELERLASDWKVSAAVSGEAGALLGSILWRQGRVLEAPLEDFTTSAYLRFDEAVASAQRRHWRSIVDVSRQQADD